VQDIEVLDRMGHHIAVVLPNDGPLTSILESLGVHVRIDRLRVLRRVARVSAFTAPVRYPRVCDDADATVLWTLALASYLPILRLRRHQIVCSVHEILPGLPGRVLADFTCSMSRALMVNSEATARWLTRNGRRKAQLAYPIAPPYEPLPVCTETSRCLQLLVMGRLNGHKGHLESVQATARVRAAGVPAELTLVGSPFPGQEQHLKTLTEYIAHLPWVHYSGEVSCPLECFRNSDIVLIPSDRPESFGIVALEAWAAGRRVIATDQGGLCEATELVEGVTVPARNIAALTRAILRVARDPTLRTAAHRNAPARTECTAAKREVAWRSVLTRLDPELG
jgi:glycosyltransferase involved in cell wall biosynthesis